LSNSAATEKFDEATRELAMRIRHYPAMVARGSLTHTLAQQRIQLMQQIALDYKARVDQQQLPLNEGVTKT